MLTSEIYTACLKAFVLDDIHTCKTWFEVKLQEIMSDLLAIAHRMFMSLLQAARYPPSDEQPRTEYQQAAGTTTAGSDEVLTLS